MKKIMILISVLLISAVMVALAFASDRDDGNSGYPGYHHSDSDGRHGDRDDRSGRDHDRDRYKKDDRNDWGHGRDRHYKYRHYKYPEKGYRSQPHGRHYGHSYRHENYEYRYHGHWGRLGKIL